MIAQDDDKNVTFSATRSPRNAIEGDLLIFPYTNPSDNSNLWIQGRLACRFDRLEDALKSDWKTNRFKIEDIRATDDRSNSELLPTAAIFNIAYDTEWILGIHNDRNEEDDKLRIVIGYYEIIKLNLAAVNESYAMFQTFEVNLLTPG